MMKRVKNAIAEAGDRQGNSSHSEGGRQISPERSIPEEVGQVPAETSFRSAGPGCGGGLLHGIPQRHFGLIWIGPVFLPANGRAIRPRTLLGVLKSIVATR